MATDSKIEAIINDEFQFPEFINQQVQSFLTGKEAAQTAVLSKSWYNAWLTRLNLDFDEDEFNENDHDYNESLKKLLKLAKKTIKRYKRSNLKIESFRLCITKSSLHRDSDLATKLIVKALKLGATNLRFIFQSRYFVIPHEVLGSENLVQLSVEGGKIDLGMDPKVRCSRLEYLSLRKVEVQSHIIFHMISSCPLIKKLSLTEIKDSEKHMASVFGGPINLHMLSCLVLVAVKIDTLFFEDFLSKFPSLRDLTLENCNVPKEIVEISSHSLERLNFANTCLKVKFDVPHIRKFTFKGYFIPSVLSFKPTSREWESHVSITDNCRLSTSWFHELSKFLLELSLSKIYLSLHYQSINFDYEAGDIQGLAKPELENLTMLENRVSSLSLYAIFDGLFRLCRPKFITQYLLPEKTSNDTLCKALLQGLNEKCSIPSHFMYGLHDLEEVNLEIFEESVAEWRSLPLKSLLDFSTITKEKQKVRFQLKWSW